ncbi:diamine N-acetyltransferase [Fistulifera solaris]|uniref:Diamine N-acetyltransferase n=1 Tax=Fistulifera solaris TaxID=1519565 RepID=A0A1Z5JKA5_FISSO|nr:diamine N-acetyltransferase [Fistulifera solaris]|eukprot:GAX14228.1 diamine N-acetyltransferase [Fistulifera solaris]
MCTETTYPQLTKDLIVEVIDRACDRFNVENTQWQLTRNVRLDLEDGGDYVHGFVANATEGPDTTEILTTFYFAYSTWNGRVLYIDERYRGADNDLKLHLRRALACIAVQLQCNRLTWQHYAEDDGEPFYPESTKPETLHGWLTLHWQADSIRSFLSKHSVSILSQDNGVLSLEDTISRVLANLRHESYQLRLATEEDLPHICRLVQGLADFEKEYDAVHVTAEHYRADGFRSKKLFQCLLLDHVSADKETYTCGMAFHYLGATAKDSLFLYLEDLFIEEQFRKNGAGTLLMKALASIGCALNCSRLVWQALDWNTPALTFYGKLGAKVQEGLLTTRYMNETLNAFCGSPQN